MHSVVQFKVFFDQVANLGSGILCSWRITMVANIILSPVIHKHEDFGLSGSIKASASYAAGQMYNNSNNQTSKKSIPFSIP